MHFAHGGEVALELMAHRTMDVIVSDMMMPRMNGAQLLTEVSNRHPHTIRLVLSGHAEREAVMRLIGPAHQYLSKPCNAEELRNALIRAFALRDLLASEQLKQLATRIRTLPSLPMLHAELARELNTEDPVIGTVGEIMSRDLGMAAKLLQLVNSAFFGLPQPITNPAEAVSFLGIATVRELFFSHQAFSSAQPENFGRFSLEELTCHSWRTALLARRIAESEGADVKLRDQCFVAGLLHDVGQLVLATGLPDAYGNALESATATGHAAWEEECDRLGASHAEVGAYLLGLWGLPNVIIDAVAQHHRPVTGREKRFSPAVAVHVADALAHAERSAQHDQGGVDLSALAALGLGDRLATWRALAENEA